MIARPSLESGTARTPGTEDHQTPVAADQPPVEADDLLEPIRQVNAMLTDLAREVGVIDQSATELTAVAAMEGGGDRSR